MPSIAVERSQQTLGLSAAILNIIKCAVGAGSFSLPAAFLMAGLSGGIVATIALGALSAYTMYLLADAEASCHQLACAIQWQRSRGVSVVVSRLTLPEVGRVACSHFCTSRTPKVAAPVNQNDTQVSTSDIKGKLPGEIIAGSQYPNQIVAGGSNSSPQYVPPTPENSAAHKQSRGSATTALRRRYTPFEYPSSGTEVATSSVSVVAVAVIQSFEKESESLDLKIEMASQHAATEADSGRHSHDVAADQREALAATAAALPQRAAAAPLAPAYGTNTSKAVAVHSLSVRRVSTDSTSMGASTSINLAEIGLYFGLLLTSVGVCAVYIDFIASTLPDIACAGKQPGTARPLSVQAAALMTAPFILALAQINSFHWLAWTSTLGNVAVLAGALAVLIAGATGATTDAVAPASWNHLPHLNPIGLPRAVGQIAFLFAIHIVTLPILSEQADAASAGRSLSISFSIVTVSNVAFGLAAAMLFGADTPSNVLDALSAGWVLQIVRGLLCVDLLLTAPMVLAAGRQVVERFFIGGMRALHGQERQRLRDAGPDHMHTTTLVDPSLPCSFRRILTTCFCSLCMRLQRQGKWDEFAARSTVRVMLVLMAFLLAFSIPDFGDLLALVGGGVNCTIGYAASSLIWLLAKRRVARLALILVEAQPIRSRSLDSLRTGPSPASMHQSRDVGEQESVPAGLRRSRSSSDVMDGSSHRYASSHTNHCSIPPSQFHTMGNRMEQTPDLAETARGFSAGDLDAMIASEPTAFAWIIHCLIAAFGIASAVASTVTVAMDLGGSDQSDGDDKCP